MTLMSLQIFNRRRPGEIERLYIEDFQSHRGLDHVTDGETYRALSAKGKKLARKYVRLEIRGKLEYILFGLPSTDNGRPRHLQAFDLMREYSVKCEAEILDTLRGTTLRMHIATRCINLNLTEDQATDLANFMGHAEKIDKDIYRQLVLETDCFVPKIL
ncbi:uncharacterized protein LOC135167527 [Diachasmimorpha longicaudata]|uniref:uncharacterized protein LOC135167527 n=1 Tax=Diachasmimorpha longicaudata TaxID=58733 RepID=UPI0030B892CC